MRTLFTLLLLAPLLLFAQTIDPASLNKAFNSVVVFKVDQHDRLVMDLFDDQGRYRQDMVPITQLAPEKIHFSVEENAIALECDPEHPHCITKEIFKLNVVRSTSRSTIPCPTDDATGKHAVEALRTLIEQASIELKGTANETAPKQARMNYR